jgi:hypothetical protein
VNAAVTGRAVAVATDEAAMGLDLDLENSGIRSAADGGKGAAATPAAAFVAGDFMLLGDRGQVRIVAAAWPFVAALLATRPAGWGIGGCCRGRGSSGAGFGLAAEELLLAQTQLGAELFVLLAQKGFAFDGALVLGFPITGLPPGFKLDGEAGADGTGSIRKGRRGAGRV